MIGSVLEGEDLAQEALFQAYRKLDTWDEDGDAWGPHSVARLELVDDRVVRIVDYVHCPWVLANAFSLAIGDSRDVSPSAGRP